MQSVSILEGVSECIVSGVSVQRVDPRVLEGIERPDYSWCNTDNHRDTETYRKLVEKHGDSDDWYRQIMEETRMEQWESQLRDLIRKPDWVVIITAKQQCKYFKPVANLAQQGCRVNFLRDKAEELAGELQETLEGTLEAPSNGWFVRTSACSPKDAQEDGGAGPHCSLVDVLLSLFASARVHTSMRSYDADVKVYLIPFDPDITVEKELRVFVHNNQVTAMSQYDVLNPCGVFSLMNNAQLARVSLCVDDFHRKEVKPRWTGISNYVMDVEYIAGESEDANPYVRLIELNSFGAEMAAASALFHWVRDADELYSSDRICIRVRSKVE